MMTSELENYATACRDAGLPLDQAENFIRAGYIAQPAQLTWHKAARDCDIQGGPNIVVAGGTRNAAKTHGFFAQVCIDDCQRYPGLKWLFLRNIRKHAAESFDDLSAKILRYVKHEKVQDKILFPNGSRVLVGGFKDASDIDAYIGLEYDGIVCEEVSQLTQQKIDAIGGSVRSARADGYRPRQYWTFNPGGIGYSYVKQKIVNPWKAGAQDRTRFFFAHYKDNIFCDEDYIAYLDGLTGHLRKSWRDGDLDAFEGAAFPQWEEDKHICKPFDMPDTWPRWRAVDYGYHPDPFCCLWMARDLDTGRVYIYGEAYGTMYTDTAQARLIRQMTTEHIVMTYGGRDMFATRVAAGNVSTNSDEYNKQGIKLTMADVDRVGGKRKIDRALGNLLDGKPGLVVFDTCENWIRTVPALVLKEGQEDIADGQEDHAYDATRYGLTNYQDIQPPKRKPEQPARQEIALGNWMQQRR
jgi:hypothetical protein